MKILLAAFLTVLASTAWAHDTDPCRFYFERETEAHCGPRGYFLAIGHPFCSLYSREADRLTDRGQQWVAQTREC
jgi:hypothetical protein